MKDESVDLVYLDPPFKSDRDYNVLFAEKSGEKAAAQIKAFTDTWEWDSAAALAFEQTISAGGKIADALHALRAFLGASDMLAYLAMMAPRLVQLRRVLKPTGSLYLHCDPTASHYLKMLMDAVFGAQNCVNEIVWHYNTGGATKGQFSKKHDVLLFYSKNERVRSPFNTQREPFRETRTDHFTNVDSTGRKYRVRNVNGKDYVYYLDEGRICHDVWDIDALNASAKERLGYPTQKPVALLERIINASSNPGDIVLDPFCGCGTTIDAAQRLGRRWIGIDVTHIAINLIKGRLQDAYGADIQGAYKVVGEPTTVEDAADLAKNDPYQFQWWALGLVGARPTEQKKGADGGIDGRLFFNDAGVAGAKAKQIIFSVKAGKLHATYVRDLRGVIEREGAQIGVMLSFEEPTKPMRKEALSAGFYDSPLGKHPRIQLLTIRELLDGRQVDYPWRQSSNVTYKRAQPIETATLQLTL